MWTAEVAKARWYLGIAAVGLGYCTLLALEARRPEPAATIDMADSDELGIDVRDSAGTGDCASSVTTLGSRVYVDLHDDPDDCTLGVIRVYRVEGNRLIFEQELIEK
jgi:hypothetical protein